MNELKEAFEFFDKSGTGSIDKKTLKASVNELGVDADVDEMFKEADSGKVRFMFLFVNNIASICIFSNNLTVTWLNSLMIYLFFLWFF